MNTKNTMLGESSIIVPKPRVQSMIRRYSIFEPVTPWDQDSGFIYGEHKMERGEEEEREREREEEEREREREEREREREEKEREEESQWCFPFFHAIKNCFLSVSKCNVYPKTQYSIIHEAPLRKMNSIDKQLFLFTQR